VRGSWCRVQRSFVVRRSRTQNQHAEPGTRNPEPAPVMRPFTSTISLDEARRRLDAAVRPIARTERVRLEEAAGRVAAADVTSVIDVPPFARAAMDGYAVVAADTDGATRVA